MDKGWKSYVLSKLSSFIKVPKDFESNVNKQPDDFIEFSHKEIEKAIGDEGNRWWN
jgi:hypothetical protein